MNIRLSSCWSAEAPADGMQSEPEILTFHCRPLSHVCYQLQVTASNFFLSKYVCFSDHPILFPLFFHSSQWIQNSLDSLLCNFPRILNQRSNVCNVLEEAGGNVPPATLNQVTVICRAGGAQVFMKPVCCYVCHNAEMKVCFPVAFSLFGEQPQRRRLQFACSSVAEMDGWHVWIH